jgi:hypothetical protein
MTMPVTRSELLFLCGGALAGALGAKNYDRIKAKVSPWLTSAGDVVGDAYTAAARRVGERIEAVQDAMAEARQAPRAQDVNGRTS